MSRAEPTLTELARVGFFDLEAAQASFAALPGGLVDAFAAAANPDAALRGLRQLRERDPRRVDAVLAEPAWRERLVRLIGASEGLLEFFSRHPQQLHALREPLRALPGAEEYRRVLLAAVAGQAGEQAWNALRIAYRRELARLAAWDLEQPRGQDAVPLVAAALADLAGAALDAALDAARRATRFPAEELALTRLAIIGMGKAGARELNYLSDVDVIFVGGSADPERLDEGRAVELATFLAAETIRGISSLAVEPALWEVDANLRPEGKDGALVRSLESHLAYYERWAKGWEFQALLKARPIAGDAGLGAEYLERIAPLVWTSAAREGFVEAVQRMRERVTEHIPADEVEIQLKLGPGGLRDIEFTVQLLQLVHGLADPSVRVGSTLDALLALSEGGYIGRVEAAEFSSDYRFLRLVEHRIQLSRLRRSHLMPRDEDALRVLARATGIAPGAEGLLEAWQRTKIAVRGLHERLFYRPLLSAVAALPDDATTSLTSEQAADRLSAIGFRDPKGALRHIAALTDGVSRRATVQRALLPVMLQWFSEGADPDYGLLTFRRISEELGEAYWYLRMLRDSNLAAKRLTQVLSHSRFVGALFERIPEAAAWLEGEEELRPRPLAALLEEQEAIVERYWDDTEAAQTALRALRRRELLRLALAAIIGRLTVQELGPALSDVVTTTLAGALRLAHRFGDGIEFGIVAMGRYGGRELGFSSDADVMYVYKDMGADAEAQARAEQIVHELSRLTEDLLVPLQLDIGLRPEGKNGAIVRSLESYRAYYERWALSWEAQALLRAQVVVGDVGVLQDFTELISDVRYPPEFPPGEVREVKRIKARVEAERLPQGADPARHLKLGRGSISDVEWYVQLLQLQHAGTVPALRTTSTLEALDAAVGAGLIDPADARRLSDAWIIASRARSALTLWSGRSSDVLPADRVELEGIARIMEYPPRSASRLEEDYLRTTRLARQVFERGFYGERGRNGAGPAGARSAG